MATYLIDYENVRIGGFTGIEALNKNDRVLVFYTNNSDNLTFELMQALNESRAQTEYIKVACGGKNALDFQLSSYLGYLIGINADSTFYLVSKDRGFETMIALWKRKMHIAAGIWCIPAISAAESKASSQEESPAEAMEVPAVSPEKPIGIGSQVTALLSDFCSPEEIEQTAALIRSSESKHEFYLGIIKLFKQQKGLAVYKLIKPEYLKLKKEAEQE